MLDAELVEDLADRYAQPGREFRQIDIVQGPIPDVDMWLCRDTLFHLPNDDVRQVLRHAAAHARYFLATTYPFARANRDVRPGGFRFLNLEAEPAATLSYRGTTLDVVARPATDVEQAEVLARSEKFYIGYRKYQARITGRRLRVFVLERSAA